MSTDDLPERLRETEAHVEAEFLMHDAADEIERLRAELAEAISIGLDLDRTHPDPYDSAYRLKEIRRKAGSS